MPNYQNTIIYKLINYDCPENVYVGSTTNWVKRKQLHKCNAINSICNYKKYVIIRETGGWESWNMVKICDFPCNNRREAEQEEDRHMLELKANMNTCRAYRTKKQYYEDNRDKLKEDKKQYYKDNKEKHNERTKEYYNTNKDKILEQQKKKYDNNKDKILEKNKKYRENNKDEISENKKEQMNCECGSCFRKNDKARHERSIKHQNYLKSITQ